MSIPNICIAKLQKNGKFQKAPWFNLVQIYKNTMFLMSSSMSSDILFHQITLKPS